MCWWRLAISAGASYMHVSFNHPRKLTRSELLMKHMYTILLTGSDDSLRHLGPGKNTTNGTRSKSTERTLKMTSDGYGRRFGPYSSSGSVFINELIKNCRTHKSPFIKSYLHKVDAQLHPSPLFPLCNTQGHTSSLQLHPHKHHIVTPGFVDRPCRSDCTAG